MEGDGGTDDARARVGDGSTRRLLLVATGGLESGVGMERRGRLAGEWCRNAGGVVDLGGVKKGIDGGGGVGV